MRPFNYSSVVLLFIHLFISNCKLITTNSFKLQFVIIPNCKLTVMPQYIHMTKFKLKIDFLVFIANFKLKIEFLIP